ncbi:MAG: NAD-dependent epimerase/dehydratase family protein, partial [Mesorhizobium sp.]
FDLSSSHVIPALMRKAHEAKRAGGKTLEVWGSGTPMREFLHVDDAADALIWLLKTYSADSHVNIGSGKDITIADLARTVVSVAGVDATITFDPTKPDGTPRKLMDVSRLFDTGWRPRYSLRGGLEQTHAWFLQHVEKGDVRLGA